MAFASHVEVSCGCELLQGCECVRNYWDVKEVCHILATAMCVIYTLAEPVFNYVK